MFQSLVKYFSFRYILKCCLEVIHGYLTYKYNYSLLWLQKLYDVLAQVHDGTVSFTYPCYTHMHSHMNMYNNHFLLTSYL